MKPKEEDPIPSGMALLVRRIFHCKKCNYQENHDITFSNDFSIKLSVPVNPPMQRMTSFVTFKADNSTTNFFIIKVCKKCGARTMIYCSEVETI